MTSLRALAVALAVSLAPRAAHATPPAATFAYDPPGKLESGSGSGRADPTLYAALRFPIEAGPAYANSQVYNPGGSESPGGSDQCDASNYTYPWRDNYCEKRSWSMPLCPSGTGHQGQDIRPATCKKDVHWVVAVTDGTITNVGSYSVYLTAADGTRFDYLHMGSVQVKFGAVVKRGQRIGRVSNAFGSSSTTVHLHFNIRQNVQGLGEVYVPPYASLVRAYQDLLGLTPQAIPGSTEVGPGTPLPAVEAPEAPAPEADADPEVREGESAGCASARLRRTSSSHARWAMGAVLGFVAAVRARRRRRRDSVPLPTVCD
jgi:murein DD-endopeptidase MepM/ murein hydrolase activator NlpD